MKIGCSTVVFREYDLDRVLETIRTIGYEYIETQGTNPWCNHVNVEKDDPIRFCEKVRGHGFNGVTALWSKNAALISCGDSCISSVGRSIEWAAAAGIPVVNCGDGYKAEHMSDEEAFCVLRDRVLQLIEIAEKNRVILAIEPHGSFSLTAKGLRRIMGISDSPYFGVNYDCANVHRSGYVETRENAAEWIETSSCENEEDTLKGIIDRVVHFHAKDLDAHRNCVALGTGQVLVKECVELMKTQGYRGVISLETEGDQDFEASVELARTSFEFLHNIV